VKNEDPIEVALKQINKTLAFQESAIRSGESWSEQLNEQVALARESIAFIGDDLKRIRELHREEQRRSAGRLREAREALDVVEASPEDPAFVQKIARKSLGR
jgi:multidrug resistance efflux pump